MPNIILGTPVENIKQEYISISRALLRLEEEVLALRLILAKNGPSDPRKRELIKTIANGAASNCRELVKKGRLRELTTNLEALVGGYSNNMGVKQEKELLSSILSLASEMKKEAENIKLILRL